MNMIFIKNFEEFGHVFGKLLIFLFILIKYCAFPWFWLLTLRGLVGHHIDFTYKFLLGKKIAHVLEEKESLINSIWWGLVPTNLNLNLWLARRKWQIHGDTKATLEIVLSVHLLVMLLTLYHQSTLIIIWL